MKLASAFHVVLILAPMLAACSSSTTDRAKGPAGAAGGDGASGKPMLGPYPDAGFGNAVGDTLPNLLLQGYVNDTGDAISNTLPFVDSYSLEDVRASGAKYALVHVSEFF